MKLFSLGFRVVVHVPCYLSEAVMFLFSALSLYFHLIFIVTFPPGVIRMNFELGNSYIIRYIKHALTTQSITC